MADWQTAWLTRHSRLLPDTVNQATYSKCYSSKIQIYQWTDWMTLWMTITLLEWRRLLVCDGVHFNLVMLFILGLEMSKIKLSCDENTCWMTNDGYVYNSLSESISDSDNTQLNEIDWLEAFTHMYLQYKDGRNRIAKWLSVALLHCS